MNRLFVGLRSKPGLSALVGFSLVLCLLGLDRAVASAQEGPIALALDREWQFRQAGKPDWHGAIVPGDVHLDLLRNGLIPDPFYRDNELKVQWIENEGWEYRREFDVAEAMARMPHVDLVCQGLDTFATIVLNGREVGRTQNMFRGYRFDVKPFLKSGRNEIVISFESPVKKETELEAKLAHKLPGGAPHLRKAPYHFGWDWGPRMVTSGIWRPIGLEAWSGARVADLEVEQDHSQPKKVLLSVKAEILSDADMKAVLKIAVPEAKTMLTLPVALVKGTNMAQATLKVSNPRLWWPAGMGDQNLYTVKAQLLQGAALLDVDSRRIGLRTLTLEQNRDEWGTSFGFKANGIPFFGKGGNWIPSDSFHPRITRAKYERLLRSCREASMNMLRVWGGGVYESEDFYNLCDELGLVVWQDFMFACAMFPGDEDFLQNVRDEAEYVVKRLRHHPSIALWCGNNECEEGWFHWGWKQTLPASVWTDYEKIFHGILPQAVARFDPQRPYWPSSPHSIQVGDPRSDKSGDMHYWGIWHGQEPFEQYQKIYHRFFSEFGFQSFPLLSTVETYTLPEDRNITAPVMEQHQKHPMGNRLIMLYLLDWFRLPKDFESLLWTSQVLQAEGMKAAAEHFRSQMPRIMGSLYWQINDCWPVASWSGLDYYGNWKALHYYARRFYNPILVAAIARDGVLKVYGVSEERRPMNVELTWSVRTYAGEIVQEERAFITLGANQSQELLSKPLKELTAGRPDEEVYFACQLGRSGNVFSSNVYHFSRLKRVALPDPRITATVTLEGGAAVVVLEAKVFAKDVYLEAPGCTGRFEDNFFDLLPGTSHKVKFIAQDGSNLEMLEKSLKIRTLRDSY